MPLNPWERVWERQARVREMTRAGMSAELIADVLGVTERQVVRDRVAAGCSQQPSGMPMSAEELRIAELMLDDGCPVNEVARTLGRSPATICRHFPGRSWSKEQALAYVAEIRRLTRATQLTTSRAS
jgi:DNA-binding NarL/FixJ family response regulator